MLRIHVRRRHPLDEDDDPFPNTKRSYIVSVTSPEDLLEREIMVTYMVEDLDMITLCR